MTRVELYEAIRRGYFIEEKSKRELAREHGVHRRDVRRAIDRSTPPARKRPDRASPVLGEHEAVIDQWLTDDQKQRPKQRHTAHRIWQRLVTERGCRAAESTVRRYVGRRRGELGLMGRDVYIEQEHQPGDEAQVDFGEADVIIAGALVTVHILLVRCSYSGRSFAMGFRRATQQAFFEGLIAALEGFGGVFKTLRFDNLSAAIKRVLRGRQRQETERFVAFRSHYLFEAEFCRPGKEGAHEKGGVEGEIGRFRRHHLVPVPEFDDIDAFNAYLADCCARDAQRTMVHRDETVSQRFAQVQGALRALPAERFDTDAVSHPRVDDKSRVRVDRNFYSVPVRYAGMRVQARRSANTVTVHHGGQTIAVHPRQVGTYQESLILDHYLELLQRKPAAMAGSKVLGQARRAGAFAPCYERLCDGLKQRYGNAAATRQLCDVLMLLRSAPAEAVTMAVELSLSYGCIDGQAVTFMLRQITATPVSESAPLCDIGDLALYNRAEPDIAHYDRHLCVSGPEVH
jgi:transposase